MYIKPQNVFVNVFKRRKSGRNCNDSWESRYSTKVHIFYEREQCFYCSPMYCKGLRCFELRNILICKKIHLVLLILVETLRIFYVTILHSLCLVKKQSMIIWLL